MGKLGRQTDGFVYGKDEMLQIYKDGHFKDAEFTSKFLHVPNATTPEYLIPLALLPIEPDEVELRLNPAAEEERHRQMIEQARAQTEAETRRQAAEHMARAQAEELAFRHEHLAREHLARQQAEELAFRQVALEEAKRRQAENEALARRQAEEVARRQVALEQQQRMLSMLPPAGAANAGSALLSLLQGSAAVPPPQPAPGSALLSLLQGNRSSPAVMAGGPPVLEQPGAQPDASARHDASAPAEGDLPGTTLDLTGWGRGRGRGRGVCSAALGTARMREGVAGDGGPLLSALGAALGGLGFEGSDGAGGNLPSMPAGFSHADVAGVTGGADEDDEGGKGKGARKKRGKKEAEDFASVAASAAQRSAAALAAEEERMLAAALAESMNTPQPGQPPLGTGQPAFSGWGQQQAAPLSLAQIQAAEEIERRTSISQILAPTGGLPPAAPVSAAGPPSKAPTSFAELMAVAQGRPSPSAAATAAADDGLLWDYGAPAPPTASAPLRAGGSPTKGAVLGAAAAAAAASSPAQPGSEKAKRGKKGKGGDSPDANGAGAGAGTALEAAASFGGSDAPMPPDMIKWCGQQMKALTGNDDTTLAQFVFSLHSEDEVHSYFATYLGTSKAVDTFANEFTLRKRAARGVGESREWQTAGGKKAAAATPPKEDENGFSAPKGRKGAPKKKVADPSMLGFSVESSRIMQGEIDFPE
ncbi:hypothetical protein Ctob_005722 [Chrysochromulina tobinii]|uniref:GYF domain-containing protein n=1 Tax=Chrysochromulina tobinii TaxID=1460289 RepID=A0A0M0JSZ5_9EUKA|nr:hypothetical protein Ctob_005722 [Chrysochromulina tobinii]|eukprot:KOO29771.1 hypothetical protein Ctob_005722 [Chrysochromulina sp. CCMP291]